MDIFAREKFWVGGVQKHKGFIRIFFNFLGVRGAPPVAPPWLRHCLRRMKIFFENLHFQAKNHPKIVIFD